MDSSVSPKDETWFLRVCHHISNADYNCTVCMVLTVKPTLKWLRNSRERLIIWRSCDWHRVKFPIIKPIRCTNFSNLFLEWNSTCFGQFLCPSSGVCHCTRSSGICHRGLLTACKQDQDGTQFNPDPARQLSATCMTPLLCVQWKTPDDGQRNCPKHVEFHSKNKFEKLVHLVGFSIRNLSRCTVTWMSY